MGNENQVNDANQSFVNHVTQAVERFYQLALGQMLREWIRMSTEPERLTEELITAWRDQLQAMWSEMRRIKQEQTGLILGDTSPATDAILAEAETIIRQSLNPPTESLEDLPLMTAAVHPDRPN
jgi:hypothetical protein